MSTFSTPFCKNVRDSYLRSTPSIFYGRRHERYDLTNRLVTSAFLSSSDKILSNFSLIGPEMQSYFSLCQVTIDFMSPGSEGIITFLHPSLLKYLMDSDWPSAVTMTFTFLGKYFGSQNAMLPSFPLVRSKK